MEDKKTFLEQLQDLVIKFSASKPEDAPEAEVNNEEVAEDTVEEVIEAEAEEAADTVKETEAEVEAEMDDTALEDRLSTLEEAIAKIAEAQIEMNSQIEKISDQPAGEIILNKDEVQGQSLLERRKAKREAMKKASQK